MALEARASRCPASGRRLHPNLAEVYRHKIAVLRIALTDPKTQTEALKSCAALSRGGAAPGWQGFEIELVGEIAARVDLGAQAKQPAPKGRVFRGCIAVRWSYERNHRHLTLQPGCHPLQV
jgi:hypothetical protein